MSKIPSGLTGYAMRQRMEDKAIVRHVGGLYIGGTGVQVYNGGDDTTTGNTFGYVVEELIPGTNGLPLVSNGSFSLPSFRTIGSNGINDNSIGSNTLGAGTIVPLLNSAQKSTFYILYSEDDTFRIIQDKINI